MSGRRRLVAGSSTSSSGAIVFDGGGTSRLFDVRGTLKLNSVTIQNGRAQYGGCLLVSTDAVLELTNVIVKNCVAAAGGATVGDAYGGAIYSNPGSTVKLTDVTITGCGATHLNNGKAQGE